MEPVYNKTMYVQNLIAPSSSRLTGKIHWQQFPLSFEVVSKNQ